MRVRLRNRIALVVCVLILITSLAGMIRFSFFGLQVISFIWMGLHVVSRAGA